jgi:predicted aconitase with swiveling domain
MQLKGRKIYKGKAEGEALVTKQSISFYGGVDPSTGTVVEKGHELEGKSIAGKILVFPTGKGSTVGSYVLYQMSKNGKGPKGLVLKECEAIVAVGCIIGGIPCIDHVDIEKLTSGKHLVLDADKSALELK